MWSICKKELSQFFSNLTGYIAIIVFLLVNGLVLFVFKNNILEYGYATLDQFFSFAPWILLFLISAITMRSFSDEFKGGTFEILQTRPISSWQIVNGKFSKYRLPRFSDMPKLEIVLLDRKDLPSAGAGETPIVGLAPAVANAIFDATGERIRSLPLAPAGVI
jgi:uncharacterized membrane-anchored protein YitT (DUF2179 family)